MTFALTVAGCVRIVVYDVGGRRVRQLAEGVYAPGSHQLTWDGRDDAGGSTPAGLYFVRLESRGTALVRKLVLASRTARW